MNVYVSMPLTLYEPDAAYRRLLRRVARLFPGATLVSPKDVFTNSRHWHETWPALLTSLDAVVIVPDGDRMGLGCLREVSDAVFRGLPVWVLDGNGGLVEIDRFAFRLDVEASPSQAVVLELWGERGNEMGRLV